MKLSYKLSIYICALIVVALLLSGSIFFLVVSKNIEQKVFSELESISILKHNQLRHIFAHYNNHASELSQDKDIINYLRLFHNNNSANNVTNTTNTTNVTNTNTNNANNISDEESDEEYFSEDVLAGQLIASYNDAETAYEYPDSLEESLEEKISALLNDKINRHYFSGAFIITNDKIIDMSTIPEFKGQIVRMEEFLDDGENYTIHTFFFDQTLKKPLTTVAVPILYEGKKLGVLVLLADNEEIFDIMAERSGMGETGETYLINSNHLMVTRSLFIKDVELNKLVYTEAANYCVGQKRSGPIISKDYRGVDVFEYYVWLDDLKLCLISSQEYSESMKDIVDLKIQLVILIIAIILAAVSTTILLFRILMKPINDIIKQSVAIGQGNFYITDYTVDKNDELHILQEAINGMSEGLKKSHELNEEFNKRLREDVELKTAELTKKIDEINKSRLAVLNMMDDINDANKRLKELDEAKTNFLNIASHELKTPLTAISAYLDVLDDYKGEFSKEQLEGLDAIKRNSGQLKTLINNILEISRIESGRFEMNITGVDVRKKILSIVDNLKILANPNVELKAEVPEIFPTIMFDDMRFDEILNNLISNAIKFTDNGSITVKADAGQTENFISIKVMDTGVGIPEDKIKNLFQNFYQVDSSISRKRGGTGLGLALTKKMIEYFGGTIIVESVLGKGTIFTVNLPIKRQNKNFEDR